MKSYLQLLRLNHWFKNLFIFAGGTAIFLDSGLVPSHPWPYFIKLMLAFLLASMVSSVNYIINQIADSEFDRVHPDKKHRPIPSGHISTTRAYILAILLFIASTLIAKQTFNSMFVYTLIALGVAGLFYNIKPIRLKDIPYIDVLSESFNNPLRFLLGWFALGIPFWPPVEFLLLSWAMGAVFMTAKRYDELMFYGKKLGPYRATFNTYTPTRLLILLVGYSLVSLVLIYLMNQLVVIPAAIFLTWFVRKVKSGQARARNIEHFVLHPFTNHK